LKIACATFSGIGPYFHQHGLAEKLEMVDTTGDFYMKIGNQAFFFLNK
jgi:hypothetical protein